MSCPDVLSCPHGVPVHFQPVPWERKASLQVTSSDQNDKSHPVRCVLWTLRAPQPGSGQRVWKRRGQLGDRPGAPGLLLFSSSPGSQRRSHPQLGASPPLHTTCEPCLSVCLSAC